MILTKIAVKMRIVKRASMGTAKQNIFSYQKENSKGVRKKPRQRKKKIIL
jgi:hypothetical protein